MRPVVVVGLLERLTECLHQRLVQLLGPLYHLDWAS